MRQHPKKLYKILTKNYAEARHIDRYKRIAYAFRKRIGDLRRMNKAFWAGEFACPGCGRDTNNGRCWDCMHGCVPETPSHAKARAEEREACVVALRSLRDDYSDIRDTRGAAVVDAAIVRVRARVPK